ncbi:CDP-glucose 4,6-dehydratase [Pseudovibrio ascidiaceicola]|uniref:CDP-glucose 4,6-dehydratase n=1 Tax=Pseudovibrio ascidiaceicola TaxID=285279 RepID=UPI000D68B857|nr:CDP-glucose 4,6-dehydratase [Pseudovibrio ascidiaceicola]
MDRLTEAVGNGRKVFLTGHTGFKGSWLALWLKMLGAEVTCFALPPEDRRGNHFNLLELSCDVASHLGDIKNYSRLKNALQQSQAEVVFHLAAQPLVRQSYKDPIENYASNVMGTVHLLEAARCTPSVRAVINITTDKCYDNKEWIWPYRETDELGGHDPYSSSKACAELVCASYRRSFLKAEGIALATARAGNVIGGGDFAEDRIIPDIVEALAHEKPVSLRSPSSIRPWQHVLDALYGYLLLCGRLLSTEGERYEGAFNFSPSEAEHVTVEQITRKFISEIGYGHYEIDETAATLHEARLLKLDPSKAMLELGWSPVLDMERTVSFTASWFAAYLENPDKIRQTSEQQIQDFMALMNEGSN